MISPPLTRTPRPPVAEGRPPLAVLPLGKPTVQLAKQAQPNPLGGLVLGENAGCNAPVVHSLALASGAGSDPVEDEDLDWDMDEVCFVARQAGAHLPPVTTSAVTAMPLYAESVAPAPQKTVKPAPQSTPRAIDLQDEINEAANELARHFLPNNPTSMLQCQRLKAKWVQLCRRRDQPQSFPVTNTDPLVETAGQLRADLSASTTPLHQDDTFTFLPSQRPPCSGFMAAERSRPPAQPPNVMMRLDRPNLPPAPGGATAILASASSLSPHGVNGNSSGTSVVTSQSAHPELNRTDFAHSRELLKAFRQVFGLRHFRENQLEACNAALLGLIFRSPVP